MTDQKWKLVRNTVGLLCAASVLHAQSIELKVEGGYLQRLRVMNSSSGQPTDIIDLHEFGHGSSTGKTSFLGGQNLGVSAADDLNLATYFARNSVDAPEWKVDLGTWWDINRVGYDFFLFEVGGNDQIEMRPVLVGGEQGQSQLFNTWQGTGYSVSGGPNKGQEVYCMAFSGTDLLDAQGKPLTYESQLSALILDSATVDGASFVFVDPQPGPALTPALVPAQLDALGQVHRVWQTSTLSVHGPRTHELQTFPNPFLDVRLQVLFSGPSGQTYDVPGFYYAEGTVSGDGDLWKAHFTPDEAGQWTYEVSMRVGDKVAVSLDPQQGLPFPSVDGFSETFQVELGDGGAAGFAKWGRLEYVGEHYLKFRDGPYFLKGGTDSPENMLAYFGFEDPQFGCNKGIVHRFFRHAIDFREGDPLFTSSTSQVDSKGLIGALNYLSERHVNSVYLLLMNLGGDGDDVFPFIGAGGSEYDNLHYDVGKLEQWEWALKHAQDKGIFLHFVLGETETPNELWLDEGKLRTQRKLYYREMVARFGHFLALKWNLSEENDFSIDELNGFAEYIRAVDPYDHPLCVHTHLNFLAQYDELYGNPLFETSSVQYTTDKAGDFAEQVRELSADSGRPWVVDMDENGSASIGLSDSNAVDLRKRVLWDIYLSGGQLEWYLGAHALPVGGDQDLEDFRTREEMWDYTWFARSFLEGLPFWEMQPLDGLLSGEANDYGGGEVFVKPGEVYALYLPNANGTGSLDLTEESGSFVKRWYDPRTGVFVGDEELVTAGSTVAVGPPPSSVGDDWALSFWRVTEEK